jgi:hypothetical protein
MTTIPAPIMHNDGSKLKRRNLKLRKLYSQISHSKRNELAEHIAYTQIAADLNPVRDVSRQAIM